MRNLLVCPIDSKLHRCHNEKKNVQFLPLYVRTLHDSLKNDIPFKTIDLFKPYCYSEINYVASESTSDFTSGPYVTWYV